MQECSKSEEIVEMKKDIEGLKIQMSEIRPKIDKFERLMWVLLGVVITNHKLFASAISKLAG